MENFRKENALNVAKRNAKKTISPKDFSIPAESWEQQSGVASSAKEHSSMRQKEDVKKA